MKILHLTTNSGILTFKVFKKFHITKTTILQPEYILFCEEEEEHKLVPTNAITTESLQLYSNGHQVLLNLTLTCLYEGFELVGRMVGGQEILREMDDKFVVEEIEFKEEEYESVDRSDGEDLVIHGDEELIDNVDEEDENNINTNNEDEDNPYVIGLAPPPEADVKNSFLSRDSKHHEKKLNFTPNTLQVDGKGRKVRGRGALKFDKYASRDGPRNFDKDRGRDRYIDRDRDYRQSRDQDRYESRRSGGYDRGYRRDRYDNYSRNRSRDNSPRRERSVSRTPIKDKKS